MKTTESSARVRLKGEDVRAIAARRNESLEDLARVVGIDKRRFYRLLSGSVSPSPQTRNRICRRLKVPFDAIFELVNSDA